jgi:acetyl-CoA carboxylase biotin carboxyl carrier protein
MSEHFAHAAADDARRAAGNGMVKDRSRGDVTHGRNGATPSRDPAPNGVGGGPSGHGNGAASGTSGTGAAGERHGGLAPGRPDREGLLRALREEVACLVDTVPGPLTRLAVSAGDCSFEITWGPAEEPAPRGADDGAAAAGAVPAPAGPADPADAGAELATCTAPLVGTFYRSPAPGEPPFVEVGDRVEAGQPVGIVEAMKLMNEIPAECSGEVVDVAVPDAAPVEFGQPLVRIRPDRPADRPDRRPD